MLSEIGKTSVANLPLLNFRLHQGSKCWADTLLRCLGRESGTRAHLQSWCLVFPCDYYGCGKTFLVVAYHLFFLQGSFPTPPAAWLLLECYLCSGFVSLYVPEIALTFGSISSQALNVSGLYPLPNWFSATALGQWLLTSSFTPI